MATMSTTLKLTEMNRALTGAWDPASNNWGAFEAAILRALQGAHAAAHVTAANEQDRSQVRALAAKTFCLRIVLCAAATFNNRRCSATWHLSNECQ